MYQIKFIIIMFQQIMIQFYLRLYIILEILFCFIKYTFKILGT